MTISKLAGVAVATVVVLLAVFAFLALGSGRPVPIPGVDRVAAPSTAVARPATTPASEADQGFLHGRVETHGGTSYEGRLRWGGSEEAFWGDFFNGHKQQNPWVPHTPSEALKESRKVEVFGFELGDREREVNLGRPFMARFGDITRIEGRGRDLRVTLKSGTVFALDGFDADDYADGLRVWDEAHGVVDLEERQIRAVEFLPTVRLADSPARLHGTVRTSEGDFTGFVQWNREKCVGSDELAGRSAEGKLSVRFDTIRRVARESRNSSRVTLLDGGEIVLSGTREAGRDNRGSVRR